MEFNNLNVDSAIKNFYAYYGAYITFRQPEYARSLSSAICVLMAYSTNELSAALLELFNKINNSDIDFEDNALTKDFIICEQLIRKTFITK